MSEVDSLAYWGYGASVSTLLVAFLGPVLGTVADTKGYKKPIFTVCMAVGVIGCAALALPVSWAVFLAVFVVAKVGYSASLIFYDAMLSDVTSPKRMDQISSQGYAWGYIGSCVPFIISLGFVLGNEAIGITMPQAMAIAFFLNAGWWFAMTVPLLRTYRQNHGVAKREHVVKESFGRLFRILQDVRKERKTFLFLVAFFFYIDGVYTIIEMATAYGSAIGLDTQGLLLALLVTQIVAFPCALLFGKAAKKYKNTTLIRVFNSPCLLSSWINNGNFGFWRSAWECFREGYRRCPDPTSRPLSRRKSPESYLGSLISAARERPLWGRPWWA